MLGGGWGRSWQQRSFSRARRLWPPAGAGSLRAICDERITLRLVTFQSFPNLHQVGLGRTSWRSRWPGAALRRLLETLQAPLVLRIPPRLVLDSAICQVNPNCSLLKAVQLRTVADVCAAFQPSDPRSMWIGASLDFKAAPTNRPRYVSKIKAFCFLSSQTSFLAMWSVTSEPASQLTGDNA